MSTSVSIIIPTYNGAAHIPPLLQSLSVQTLQEFEVILVDNASSDASLELAQSLCQQYSIPLCIVRNDSNRGFAPACNQGIRASHSPWIVLLNNDTRPEAQWLERLVATAQHSPEIGMVSSKMLFAHDPQQINSCGIALDRLGIAWDWRGGQVDDPSEEQVVEIFGPCGGAALYARQMLEEIGELDEDFFAYLEDVDLAWRARLAGWRCLYQPQARIYHAHSATLGEGSPFKSFLLGRNKVWLIAKNYPPQQVLRYLPWVILYDLMAVTYGILSRGDLASLRGRLAGLGGLSHFLRKRRAIHQRWQDVENWQRTLTAIESPWAILGRYSHLRAKNTQR